MKKKKDKPFTYKTKSIAFCILGGGKSSRFNDDKRFAKIRDKRLIDFVLSLAKTYTPHVYLSIRMGDNVELDGIKIEDTQPYGGPLCGIYNTMKKVDADYYIFLAADMPFVSREMIDALIKATEKNHHIAIFKSNNLWTPLPILLSKHTKSFFDMHFCKDKSIKELLKQFNMLQIDWKNPINLFNINTREDLSKAEAILHSKTFTVKH